MASSSQKSNKFIPEEEIQKKTGYIVMRAEDIYDVDANTSIDELSEELNLKMPEVHQYETVSGFDCEVFGYISKTGESVTVVLKKENWEENDESKHECQDPKEKNQIYRLETDTSRKCQKSERFERVNEMNEVSEARVRNIVPKFVRKWSSEEDSDGNHQAKIAVFGEHLACGKSHENMLVLDDY